MATITLRRLLLREFAVLEVLVEGEVAPGPGGHRHAAPLC
jgi:hypothetical protein